MRGGRLCPEWLGSGDAEERVNTCVEFYWDQCLHGIESGAGGGQAAAEPTTTEVDACAAAVGEARACASAKVASMAEARGAARRGCRPRDQPLRGDHRAGGGAQACAFVAAPNGGGAGIGSSGNAGSGGSGGGSAGNGGGSDVSGSGSDVSGGGSGGRRRQRWLRRRQRWLRRRQRRLRPALHTAAGSSSTD